MSNLMFPRVKSTSRLVFAGHIAEEKTGLLQTPFSKGPAASASDFLEKKHIYII